MVTTDPSTQQVATPPGHKSKSKASKAPRPQLGLTSRIHYLAGLLVAPLIIVAAISGFFYVLAPSIDDFLYRDEMTATSQEAPRPVDEQVEAAKKVYPNLQIKGVQLPDRSTEKGSKQTTRVLFADPELISASYTHAVFVDPGSLEIKGDLVQYGSGSALPFRTWLSKGHKNLWLGDPGRIYSETAASWLGPMALTGIAMWWLNRRRSAAQKSTRKPAKSSRRFALNRHSTIGIIAVPGLLFLCASGLTWSVVAGENISAVRKQLDWMPTEVVTSAGQQAGVADPHAGHEGHEGHAGHPDHAGMGEHTQGAQATQTTQDGMKNPIDRVAASARSAGLTGRIELTPPAAGKQFWKAAEVRQPYKMHNDAVSVDPVNGKIMDNVPFSSWPIAAQLTSWAIQLHMGFLFGIISEVAFALLALAILALTIYGYMMWWRRVRSGRKTSLRRVTPTPLQLGVAALLCVAYSILAPLFGVSLVLILLLAWAWKAIDQRRDKLRAQSASAESVDVQKSADEAVSS